MCLACNILNALGTNPVLTAPKYPGPLPGGITGGGKQALTIHLLSLFEGGDGAGDVDRRTRTRTDRFSP